MHVLEKWSVCLCVPQVILGGLAYLAMTFLGEPGAALPFAFFVAWGVATAFAFVAMAFEREVGVAVGMASVALPLALLGALAQSVIVTSAFLFFVGASAFLAALIMRRDAARGAESLQELFLGALPVVGALLYVSSSFRKERETQ